MTVSRFFSFLLFQWVLNSTPFCSCVFVDDDVVKDFAILSGLSCHRHPAIFYFFLSLGMNNPSARWS